MEIFAEVWSKRLPEMVSLKTNQAYFTFVALDDNGKPTKINPIKPVLSHEKKEYNAALKRKESRVRN